MKLSYQRVLFTFSLVGCSLIATLIASTMAIAEEPNPESHSHDWTADTSDPNALEWMQGFPPPEDKIIRFDDNGTGSATWGC